jgi:hypothetical protein
MIFRSGDRMLKTVSSCIATLLLGFVGGIVGTLTMLHREKANIQQEVRARQFELVDEGGEVVSIWGIDHLQNPVIVFAPSGFGKEERPFEGYLGHKLSLNDPDSQRVGIGLTADGDPFFKFRGHDEKPRASLYVDSDGKPVFILSDEQTARVLLGVRRSDTPGPQDNDWGLDFYPDRAGIGMACVRHGAQTMLHGYFYLHEDGVPF